MDPQTELYFVLSECYKEPEETFAREVAEEILYQVMVDNLQALGIDQDVEGLRIPGSPEEVLQQLKRAYYPLFVIPPRFVMPVESVYKEWAGEDGFLSGSRGLIMGPSATDMLRRYQAHGIQIPQLYKDYPDHLALLLEYGGLLCEEGDVEELGEFVASHFDGWIEEFAEQVRARTESRFYKTVVEATVAFVQSERMRLGVVVS